MKKKVRLSRLKNIDALLSPKCNTDKPFLGTLQLMQNVFFSCSEPTNRSRDERVETSIVNANFESSVLTNTDCRNHFFIIIMSRDVI